MRSAWTVMPRATRSGEMLHVVERDRGVRQDHPLGAGVGDVALVPQRDVLERGLGVAAQHAREARDALADDRVALVGHRARALLARAERLLDLAHLRALQVPDLGREALEAGARERDGAARSSAWRSRGTTCVETGSRASPSRVEHACLVVGPERRRRFRPRRRSRRSRPGRRRAPAAPRCGAASSAKPASLSPNDVGSACTPWVRPTHSVPACSRARSASAAASARAPGTTISPARRSCSASAVSSTSDEVSP